MNIPLITVYITNYNYGNYIKQAVESVLNQSFQNFELLIIDDGSTDNSKEIIESYANHSKIKVIYQQNKGLNITNNIALRLANGKYIMRLDADDYLVDNALEKMTGALEADDELGLVFPDYYLVDHENNVTAEIKRHDFDDKVKLMDQPAHGACTVIRTAFLKSVGGYDETYSCQDGYELWIKFITHFKVSNIKEPLFYYRRHGENLTTNENRILDTRKLIKENFISKNKISLPNTIGIVPVRNTRIGKERLAFTKLGGKNLIDLKIESLLNSTLLSKIVVTSSEEDIENHIEKTYANNEKVKFIKRPTEMARFNVSLNGTIDHVFVHLAPTVNRIEAFMILPIEYPFLTGGSIDDAIHTLAIFKADSVISVRLETATLYHHYGEGMVPILNQENFTKLEREALYKGVGGLTLTTVRAYHRANKLLAGNVGHIVVGERTAHGIFTAYDFLIAKFLIEEAKKFIKS